MKAMGQKRTRGIAANEFGEVKNPHRIALTPTVWDLLGERAQELGLSRSEVLERTIRGLIEWPPIDCTVSEQPKAPV